LLKPNVNATEYFTQSVLAVRITNLLKEKPWSLKVVDILFFNFSSIFISRGFRVNVSGAEALEINTSLVMLVTGSS
jgi:hypothetical protein